MAQALLCSAPIIAHASYGQAPTPSTETLQTPSPKPAGWDPEWYVFQYRLSFRSLHRILGAEKPTPEKTEDIMDTRRHLAGGMYTADIPYVCRLTDTPGLQTDSTAEVGEAQTNDGYVGSLEKGPVSKGPGYFAFWDKLLDCTPMLCSCWQVLG